MATNEPETHPVLHKGAASKSRNFAFLPSLGMRLAPEVVVNELFREIFFEDWSASDGKEQQLSPLVEIADVGEVYCKEEQALLYAARGRSKRRGVGAKASTDFFAPLFPRLARGGWPRKQSEHLIKEQLILGPVAQHLLWRGGDASAKVNAFATSLVRALSGTRGRNGGEAKEIFSRVVDALPPLGNLPNCMIPMGEAAAIQGLVDTLDLVQPRELLRLGAASGTNGDSISSRMFHDLEAIIELEKSLPRLQWMEVFKCFLRVVLAIWVIARTRITVMLRDWLIEALAGGQVPEEKKLLELLNGRYRSLFHPTLTPTDELGQHIDRYIVARIETNLLLAKLDEVNGGELRNRYLTTIKEGADALSIEELLQLARTSKDSFSSAVGGLSPRQYATREGEKYPAWGSPRKYGVGKNLDEFLRVIKPGGEGDSDRGYLVRQKRAGIRGQIVFPGAALINTFVFLAEAARRKSGHGRKLILRDLEDHFESYGIAFKGALAARPRLIHELIVLGLLKGSPDAGDSAELRSPY